jgi:glycosyltransferase involved in cell wall biosynthesis
MLHITTIDLTAYCFLRTKFKHFRAHGHEVALATTFGRFRADLEPCCDLCFGVDIPRRIRPWQDFQALLQLVTIIRGYRPDVVHTYTSKAGLLGRLAARLCRVPLIVHTIYELPQNSTTRPWLKKFYWLLEKLAALWGDHFVTISQVNVEQILTEKICPRECLSLIREGIELERYHPQRAASEVRAQWGLPGDAKVLGIAARLEPAKGHRDLLQAFAILSERHPKLHLMVMGTGELKEALESEVLRLNLKGRVHFLGWVEDLVSSIAALDLFVLSSHYEGLGLVLLEALAVGVAVVSTRVGGTQDIVEHEVTGLFAPPHDPKALAQTIERLLLDPELAQRLARAGRRRVEKDFRSQMADALSLELYEKLGSRQPPTGA